MIEHPENPSPNGDNGGRDRSGRFTNGNKGGPGNPLAARSAKIRAALMKAVTVKDIVEIARKLVEKAKGGDLAASKILFDRVLGPTAGIGYFRKIGNRGTKNGSKTMKSISQRIQKIEETLASREQSSVNPMTDEDRKRLVDEILEQHEKTKGLAAKLGIVRAG